MATKKTRSTDPKPPAASTRRKAKPAAQPQATETSTEYIRVRAYYLSLERNGSAADPLGDWLRAERELIIGSSDT